MMDMRRTSRFLVTAGVGVAAVAIPAVALATQIELGATHSPLVSPVCPTGVSSAQCTIILTRVTALETLRDGVAYPTKVKKAGRITAFTVGLSQLSSNKATRKSYIHYLDTTYGGTTRLAITVLRPGGGAKTQFRWQAVAESAIYHVEPYLGSVVQIPLDTTLEVKPGDVIALTTPTWAPVLTINVAGKKFAYRQSRSANCGRPPASSQAQLTTNQTASYACDYPGTRVEYSATEVTYPLGSNPVH
jgi:uncharacterized RmlC-like cupin family protein